MGLEVASDLRVDLEQGTTGLLVNVQVEAFLGWGFAHGCPGGRRSGSLGGGGRFG